MSSAFVKLSRILKSGLSLLRSAPALPAQLQQTRGALERARGEFEREEWRLEQARRRTREQREILDAERKELERREQSLKQRRRRFKGSVRDYLLSTMPERSVCAEIGVHEGEFSRRILDVAAPERLHLIDPWEHLEEYENALFGGLAPEGQASLDERYDAVLESLSEEIEAGRVKVHRDYSSSAAAEFSDSYFDWIYVDGNHLYEFVKQDLETYYPKIKPGGYMLGDDYGGRGWWRDGVREAVDEFVRTRPELDLRVVDKQFVIRLPESG